jgi:serine/threonine protein phosphatase 1
MGLKSNPQRYLTQNEIEKVLKVAEYHSQPNNLPYVKRFVMSDIHGMDEYLMNMLEYTTEIAKKEGFVADYIFLGDYVDRGYGTAQVLAIVRLLQEAMPEGRVITLRGNHEEMFINEHFSYPRHDMSFYSSKTGKSFSKIFKHSTPPADLGKWMKKLPYYFEDKLHLFVHAGIRPNIPIHEQRASDMVWIREGFLFYRGSHPKYIVHGHTPTNTIDIKHNRCCVDTGAVFDDSRYLTCAEINSDYTYPVAYHQIRIDEKITHKLINGNYATTKGELIYD